MKVAPAPRPSRDELRNTPVHVVVRDYPETLAELRAAGVAVPDLGDRTIGEIGASAALLDALEAVVAWRPGSATG